MKMPAFQFYPADWRKDPGIQALDRHDRSVWFDMLCIMHESDERGVLLLAGRPIPEDALARMLNLDNQTFNQTLTNLLTYGVASRRESDGAVYSRRMVKDEALCQVRRLSGKKGGNPGLVNQNPKQNPTTGVNQNPTPSSSISSTSSKEEKLASSAGLDEASPVESPTPEQRPTPRAPKLYRYDNAPVFIATAFREYLNAQGYGHVDWGMYLVRIADKIKSILADPQQRKIKQEATNDEWKAYILSYLDRDKAQGKLLRPEPETSYPAPNRSLQLAPTTTSTTSTSYGPERMAAQAKKTYL